MKKLLILALSLISLDGISQTHETINKERCWIVREFSDPIETYYVVVIETEEMENEKQRIEEILKSKLKASIVDRLNAQGFRVEIFRKKDVTPLKKMALK